MTSVAVAHVIAVWAAGVPPAATPTATSAPASADATGATITGAVIGAIAVLIAAVIGNYVNHRLQMKRDQQAHQQQRERDEREYERQRERDQREYQRQREREDQARQDERERRIASYRRSMEEARRKRLRDAYKVILLAARAYESAVSEMQIITSADKTQEARDKRVEAYVQRSLRGVNQALVALALEHVGADVNALFVEMRTATIRYFTTQANIRDYGKDTAFRADVQRLVDDLQKYEVAVHAKLEELETAMRSHLSELEQPHVQGGPPELGS